MEGGLDAATLHDSDGDDLYTANPDSASMTDGFYLHVANGFDSATGTGSGQAGDEAVLRDSDQPDSLTADRVPHC